jgi:dienelactone hydrolase
MERAKSTPTTSSAVAIEFAERGWAVLAVMRRGYGLSEGQYSESNGGCANPDYVKAGRGAAQDVAAGIAFMRAQDYVDSSRLMLVGNSAGGFASLAAASERPQGLLAVLSFSGGRGSTGPDKVCGEDKLTAAFATFGRTVTVPTLWLNAANDHFFRPALFQQFFAAFTKAGGQAELVPLPAFGDDGHYLFSAAAIPLWRDRVDGFLRQHGLPTWSHPVIPPLPPLPPVASWSAKSRQEFDRYSGTLGFEKALAVGKGGGFAWVSGRRSTEQAMADAMADCAKRTTDCRPYAIGDRLAR